MEQGFKIAIWMLCLTGYLQAKPVPWSEVLIADLDTDLLRKDVKCGNETFTHPTNVKESCRLAAVKHFIGQLELARKQCSDEKGCIDGEECIVEIRINRTLQTLDQRVLPQLPNNTSTCQLETTTSQFEIFVNATEIFVQNLNSNTTGSGK